MNGPLEGMKVIELGQLIAAPFAGRILAEYGAEVIKVEPPRDGDPLRRWRKLHKGTSLWSYLQSRNKKSISVDLRQPVGQDVIRRLVRDADILIENFRPGTLERWGLGWEPLSKLNPSLILVRISGYGQTGPYSSRPGFGAIGEAMGGIRYTTGSPDRVPSRNGISLGDSVSALYAVIGALMAKVRSLRNGDPGQVIDVSLAESVLNLMESVVPEYDLFGEIRERSGSTLPGIAPSNAYEAGDGAYIVIAANGDSIFKRLMAAIGREDLRDDPQFEHNDGRAQHAEFLDEVIEEWTSQRTAAEVLSAMDEAGVPAGRIYSAADIADDPHYQARDMLVPVNLPDGTPVRFPGIAPKLSMTPGKMRWIGPDLGAHTDEVLQSIGYSEAEIEQMRASGTI